MATSQIPGASVYAQAVELAKKKYQTRLADITKQRQSTMRQAGFTADIDEGTGLASNMRTDPYNQYGQYQQLNRAQSLRSDELQSMNIGRGISSRGGLGRQNLGNLRYEFGKEDSAFGQNLTDMMSQYTRQQQEEKFGYDEALWQAQQEAAQAAIAAGDYGASGEGGGYDWNNDGVYDDALADPRDESDWAYRGPPMADPLAGLTAKQGQAIKRALAPKPAVAVKKTVKNQYGSGGRAPVTSAKPKPKPSAAKPVVKKPVKGRNY